MTDNYGSVELCVLIPCFNDRAGLLKAVNSIGYEPGRCLVLVVDDGSHIPLGIDDIRNATTHAVQLIALPVNKGIAEALNTGLQWIIEHTHIPYIARLDCRDICHPQRFFQQVAHLKANLNTGLVGSWCRFQNHDGSIAYNYTTPVDHEKILRALALRNVFMHPTVVFRSDLLQKLGLYPKNYPHAEDYAFFWAMAAACRVAIIPEILVTCFINREGISMQHRTTQLKSRLKVVRHFEKNPLRRAAGTLKLRILMLVPYAFILRLKRRPV